MARADFVTAGELLPPQPEQFFQSALDALATQIAIIDATGRITVVNAAWHRFAAANGYTDRDHGVGQNYLAICEAATGPGAEDAAALAGRIREVLRRDRDVFSLVYPCHSPEQRRWFIARVSCFPGDGPAYAVIAHEDITEQHQVEEALRESEARFRTIFMQVMDAILIADDEGHYLQANPAACALYGVSDEADLLGHWRGDFAPPALRSAVQASWRQFLADGRQSGSFIVARADGTTRTVEYQATANLQLGQHVSILRDVTQRELAVAELANIRRELVTARETERLRLARELHDTAVQQLLGISFQLAAYNEPAGAARTGAEPAATPADLRRSVLDTVVRLRGMIRELRPAGLEEFGLTAALDGYLSAVKRERGNMLPAITIDLDHVGDSLPHAIALCLFRVAQESLQNAIRHADAREIAVTLVREARAISLRIVDDGRGFQVPERLTMYTQLGHFGLAGMVERANLAQGSFAIESVPGGGTTVTMRIPLGGSWDEGIGGEDA